jgi:hypothetical protein
MYVYECRSGRLVGEKYISVLQGTTSQSIEGIEESTE